MIVSENHQDRNAQLGHSLARRATGLNSSSYLVRGDQATLERGQYRVHGPLGDRPREQGPEVFNTLVDRLEQHNLYGEAEGRAAYDSLLPFVRSMGSLNTWLVESDRLWPDSAAASAE